VDWFSDGDVRRIVKELPIDLIILDLMLPKRSGFSIFEDLRALPELNSIPIVAVSAMDSSVAIPEAQKLGFSGFISKPIDPDLFAQQLLGLIEGKNVWYGL
jgi:DNA-binding response OmpR family regulator